MEMDKVDIQELKDELDEAQEKITKAAMFGTMLLEENEDLKCRMDELRKSTDKRLEFAEQEKHGLQVKLDQKCSMEAWYNEEISHLKQQLSEGQENLRDTLEAERVQEVARLTRQIDELRADMDQASSTEAQLRQTNSELEALLQERLNQTEPSALRSFGTSEEVSELQEEVTNLQNEVTGLKSQLIERKSDLQSALIEMDNLRAKVIARDEELEDIRCQFTTVNNALEQARVEKLDLKCQLDALRMETSGHNKKGNSIFSELDDRRVDAEKKLISLNVANQTLTEKYNVEKQQNQKYKRQISQLLLQMSSGRVDNEYVANIESKLSQARQEVRALTEEKSQLQEKQQSQVALMSELSHGKAGDGDYVKYLITLIEGKDQELQKTKQELSYKSLQLLDEKSRTSTQESKIIQLDAEKDKLRSHNMKLALKVEELRLKYEPDSIKKSGVLVVKRTEKIPLDDPEEVKITETSRIQDASTLSQSQTFFQPSEVGRDQKLTDKVENIPVKSCVSVSKYLKTKSVAISDEIEEHEIENLPAKEEESETISRPKQKGTRLTAIKHISKDSSKQPKDVNECKNQ